MSTTKSLSSQMQAQLKIGMPPDHLHIKAGVIKAFIDKNNLKQVAMPTMAAASGGRTAIAELPAASRLIDLGIRGGIRVPHLHFGDDVFMLTEKQWKTFSKEILLSCKAALSKAQTISFENAVDLTASLGAMAGS